MHILTECALRLKADLTNELMCSRPTKGSLRSEKRGPVTNTPRNAKKYNDQAESNVCDSTERKKLSRWKKRTVFMPPER